MRRIAETLKLLGLKRAMVVHSNGLDEISTMGPTEILHLERRAHYQKQRSTPSITAFGGPISSSLAGGDAETNAGIIRDILDGRENGPRKDIVLLNAAAAIMVAGLAEDFVEGIELADKAVKRQRRMQCLQKLDGEISNN